MSFGTGIFGTGAGAFFSRKAPRLRAVLTFVALIAFSCQSVLIQTHLHGLGSLTGLTGAITAVSALDGDGTPPDMDRCLLCQEAIHAGQYVLPTLSAALSVIFAGSTLPSATTQVVPLAPRSHAWRGRAPPQLR